MFGMEKLKWCGCPMVKSLMTCLAILTEYWRVMDRQIDILQWHNPRYHVVKKLMWYCALITCMCLSIVWQYCWHDDVWVNTVPVFKCSRKQLKLLYGYFVSLLWICTFAASLCNVADVSLTTKSAETEVASTYEFDCSGNILKSAPSHLPQGN